MNFIQKIYLNAKILDIGAGIGKSMIALKKLGYDVYGIETSLPFYEKAIEKMGVEPEKLMLASIEDCVFEENFFDVIFFTAVLEHLTYPAETLQKIMKGLKPNGLIFIEVPSADWQINRAANLYYKMTGTDYVANLSPMHTPYHLYEFTKKSFEAHSKSNNYKIVDCRYYVCETFMPKIFSKNLKKYMHATNSGMELAIWLQKMK